MNPLVITTQGNLHCLDAKLVADSNALYRQPKLRALHDPSQEDEREARAAQWELNYVALEGNIGCMVNGAGLAMGTMDIVKLQRWPASKLPGRWRRRNQRARDRSIQNHPVRLSCESSIRQHFRWYRSLRHDR